GIPTVLRHLGIYDWFGAIVTSEDVVRQKPAPDIFLEAARQLGVDPAHCRGFEGRPCEAIEEGARPEEGH
ncbi:HAD family phosphatase, partial [bacterium]|nr:HAD family phosphatase [bacterium]